MKLARLFISSIFSLIISIVCWNFVSLIPYPCDHFASSNLFSLASNRPCNRQLVFSPFNVSICLCCRSFVFEIAPTCPGLEARGVPDPWTQSSTKAAAIFASCSLPLLTLLGLNLISECIRSISKVISFSCRNTYLKFF